MLLQDPNAQAGKFGFAVDNTIGATPQPNGWMDNWVDFYRERRIKHQLQLLGTVRPITQQLADLVYLSLLSRDTRGTRFSSMPVYHFDCTGTLYLWNNGHWGC